MIFPVPDGNVIVVSPEVAVTEELPEAVVVGRIDVSPLIVPFAVPLAVPLMILVAEPLLVPLPDEEVIVPDADVSVFVPDKMLVSVHKGSSEAHVGVALALTDEGALVALPEPDVEPPVVAEDEAGVEEPMGTHTL